jgi:hypothetical protein
MTFETHATSTICQNDDAEQIAILNEHLLDSSTANRLAEV